MMQFFEIVFWLVWKYDEIFNKKKRQELYEETEHLDDEELNW